MAAAGVRWVVGREGNAAYSETVNGVQLRPAAGGDGISPYQVTDRPSSGLLPGIVAGVGPNGSADDAVQADNFRLCLTRAADRLPFPRPDGYDARDYELLRRRVERGSTGPFLNFQTIGRDKSDVNNEGLFSTDYIGASHGYPTAGPAERARIVAEHRRYQQGLLRFLANDPAMPPAVRAGLAGWGLPADEWTATGGWPPQLYVREARRMVSDHVMTEHHCLGAETVADPVGLASYAIDFHSCRRVAVGRSVVNEGWLWLDDLPHADLAARLRADGQVLDWPGPLVDNSLTGGVTRTGTWIFGGGAVGHYGPDYGHDGNAGKGTKRLRFTATLPRAGRYVVYLRWSAAANRATNVPVDVIHAGGVSTVTVNQRRSGGEWVPLGAFRFQAGRGAAIEVRTDGTDGYVVADAVRFARV
jgi:hypothetical protein